MSDNLQRALAAKAILENPEFKAAVTDTKTAILEAIGNTKPEDHAYREFLYRMTKALPFVEMVLNARLNGGLSEVKSYLDKQKLDADQRGE